MYRRVAPHPFIGEAEDLLPILNRFLYIVYGQYWFYVNNCWCHSFHRVGPPAGISAYLLNVVDSHQHHYQTISLPVAVYRTHKLLKFYQNIINNYLEVLKTPLNIRSLYEPVQPGPKHPADGVTYQEMLPDARLQDYIYCYWQLQTRYPLTMPFHYRVIADGCMDVYFELKEPDKSYVMGFANSFVEFELARTFNYVGVRFFPSMFPQLYKISAAELSNRAICLDNVLPDVAKFLEDSFSNTLSPADLKVLLDGHFLQHISNTVIDADNRLYESIHLILQQGGTVSIEKELPQGISVRQLRRLFEFYIGDTPKEFSRVVRFQKTLQAPEDYLNLGYYDQAHFIKEFRNLYGLTPGKALLK